MQYPHHNYLNTCTTGFLILLLAWSPNAACASFQNLTPKGRSPSMITSTTPLGGNPIVCIGYQVSAPVKSCLLFSCFLSISMLFTTHTSLLSADKEYLHKERDGNVFLHNAETNEKSLYLSNSTFVIHFFFPISNKHNFVNAE